LTCTDIALGVNGNQCLAYGSGNQGGFCDARGECLALGGSNLNAVVATCSANAAGGTRVVAECGSAQCIRPGACAAQTLVASLTLSSFCFTSGTVGEGSCASGFACSANGTCTAIPQPIDPPTEPETPEGGSIVDPGTAIIGGAVGGSLGGLLLIGSIVLIVWLVRRKGGNKDMITTVHADAAAQQHQNGNDDETSDDGDGEDDDEEEDGGEEEGEEEGDEGEEEGEEGAGDEGAEGEEGGAEGEEGGDDTGAADNE